MPWEGGKKEIVRHVNELVAQLKNKTYHSPFSQNFAEIYVETPEKVPDDKGASQNVPSPLHLADGKRNRFLEMRRLAGILQTTGYLSGSTDRMQAVLFYRQAKFMENFEDDYKGNAPFSMYFPCYQMMSYEQLRTYFTWRSEVRRGVIRETSFSYAFLYLYELINNIGVKDCRDGLEKLASFWDEYRQDQKKLDKYMNEWVKDYYITNDFSEPFEELLQKTGNLQKLYRPSAPESLFDFYYPYSDYKIRKSAFYNPETAKTIGACFSHVVKALNDFMLGQGKEFEDLIFYSKSNRWTPFSDALYCSFSRQNQSRVAVISEIEKYKYENGRWTSSKNKLARENGRFVVGYILKRIEQFFRKTTKYKYKITANRKKISMAEIARIVPDPESFFRKIDEAIVEYYRLSQRKIITVDTDRLDTIRANAQMITEKLLVDGEYDEADNEEPIAEHPAAEPTEIPAPPAETAAKPDESSEAADEWDAFARSLSETEKEAVQMVLQGAPMGDFQNLAKSSGLMPEVLADRINQKAIDSVDDNIMELSDQITIFDEYREDLKRVIRIERR